MRVKQRLVTFQEGGHRYEISWGGWDDIEPGGPGWEVFYLGVDGDDWTSFNVRDDPRDWSDDELVERAREIIAESGRSDMAAADPAGVLGTVYLLHFNQLYVPYPGAPAICCAGHYTGFAPGGPRGLRRRLAKHGTAEGARLMLVITRAGIGWQVARIWWPGNRTLERRLKVQGGASRRCPLCGVVPRPGPLPRNTDGRVSRILTTDLQKDAAGLMTAAQLAEHSGLRHGAVTGRLARPLDRGPLPAGADPWALPVPVLAGGETA